MQLRCSCLCSGGHAILDAIAAQDYNTLRARPVVTKAAKLRLLGGAVGGQARIAAAARPRRSVRAWHEARSAQIAAAYALLPRSCQRGEAKNFYYAFRVLPQHKSDAMCAVYAFMRKADDLADDESLSLDARREAMAVLDGRWRASRTGPRKILSSSL